jgi:hypothetical protein
MALPPPYPTATLESIKESLGDNPLAKLEDLRPDDLVLIAAFIQTFNFVELNLRRSVSAFVQAGLVEPKKRQGPSDLVDMSVAAVMKMDPATENVADTVGRLKELEFRRPFRNLFAHWAAKRIRNQDALYLMSHDSRDVNAVQIGDIDCSRAGFAIVLLPDIRGLVGHIAHYETWLSRKTAEWHERYVG